MFFFLFFSSQLFFFFRYLPRINTDVGLSLGGIDLVTREGANLKPNVQF